MFLVQDIYQRIAPIVIYRMFSEKRLSDPLIGARFLYTFILGPSVLEPNLDLQFGQIQLLGEKQPSCTRHVLHSTVLWFHVHGLLAGECRSLAPHNSVLPDSTASDWKQTCQRIITIIIIIIASRKNAWDPLPSPPLSPSRLFLLPFPLTSYGRLGAPVSSTRFVGKPEGSQQCIFDLIFWLFFRGSIQTWGGGLRGTPNPPTYRALPVRSLSVVWCGAPPPAILCDI